MIARHWVSARSAGLLLVAFHPVLAAQPSVTPVPRTATTQATTQTLTPPPRPPAATSTSTPISPGLPPAPASTPAITPALSAPPTPATSGFAPVFSAPAFTPPASTATADEPAFEPGQLLVLWTTDEIANNGVATLLQRYQVRPRQRYSLAGLGFTLVMLTLPTDQETQTLRTQLRAEQPEWIIDLNARSLPLQAAANPTSAAPRFYAAKMLGGDTTAIDNAKSITPSLRVGVIDTGVDPALLQPTALNGSTITLRSVLSPADKAAEVAHGSAVLQLMVGSALDNGFAGSAPPVLIFWASAMREIAGKPSTNSLSLALALDWLASQQVALINMSLGGQGDDVLKAVIDKVLTKNIAILAAVGNNPANNAPPVYPAAYAGVWGITAVDAAGKLYTQASRASYATLAAPGVELWVPVGNAGQTGGNYVNGTSYASALASAALAWQSSHFWALPSEQRRSKVCAQARKLTEDAVAGCGLVQKSTQP
jgi:Subtilase family